MARWSPWCLAPEKGKRYVPSQFEFYRKSPSANLVKTDSREMEHIQVVQQDPSVAVRILRTIHRDEAYGDHPALIPPAFEESL